MGYYEVALELARVHRSLAQYYARIGEQKLVTKKVSPATAASVSFPHKRNYCSVANYDQRGFISLILFIHCNPTSYHNRVASLILHVKSDT